ncbi:MAG: IclR family transcriptional regulator [Dysosmobacter sp.]
MREYSVSSIVKAAEILEYLKNHKASTFSQIQVNLGYAKSSTYQILKTLENLHMVSVNQYGEYSLGYKLYELGHAFGQNIGWRNIIAPYIRQIADETGLTVHVSILTSDYEGICIEKIPGKIFTMQLTEVGTPLQMHSSASGKVLLAWQPPDIQAKILNTLTYQRFTEHTITSKEALAAELLTVRKNGYAYDDQESEEVCRGVAAPLFACDGSFLAGVSIGAPTILMAQDQMSYYATVLQTYLSKISPLLNPNQSEI